jgi:hypothetical protein
MELYLWSLGITCIALAIAVVALLAGASKDRTAVMKAQAAAKAHAAQNQDLAFLVRGFLTPDLVLMELRDRAKKLSGLEYQSIAYNQRLQDPKGRLPYLQTAESRGYEADCRAKLQEVQVAFTCGMKDLFRIRDLAVEIVGPSVFRTSWKEYLPAIMNPRGRVS